MIATNRHHGVSRRSPYFHKPRFQQCTSCGYYHRLYYRCECLSDGKRFSLEALDLAFGADGWEVVRPDGVELEEEGSQ